MSRNKELEILLVITLLISVSIMPVAVGANWEEIAKNSSLKIAILGDSTEIKESLVKSANASNICTSDDINSDIFEQVNIIFINTSYLKNLQGTGDKEAVASRLDALAHSGKTMIAIGSNPEVLYDYVKPNSMFIDLNSGQQTVVALGEMIFPDNTSAGKFTPGNISQATGEMFIWAVETIQAREENNQENPISTVPVIQEKVPLDIQEKIPITEKEKAYAVEVAWNDTKVKESLPVDAEVIAVEIPPYAQSNDKIYNVIFKYGDMHDIITVNLTSGKVESSVSLKGEYQPKLEDLPMPVFREDVIIYFKEMPESLEEFASKYNVKLIFAKQDIKFAAFETNPVGRPGEVSNATLNFINEVSKNPLVEEAFHDGFMFTRQDSEYSSEPKLTYPENMKDEYVPNQVIVGFWRFPPSLDEFASKHGGQLKNFGDADNVLKSALFETNNITEFIKNVSTDPYVRYAEPNGIARTAGVENITLAAGNTPKVPGFVFVGGLISLLGVWVLGRKKKWRRDTNSCLYC